MLGALKKMLSQCHIQKSDNVLKIVSDTDARYMIQRAVEEINLAKEEVSSEEADRRLVLSIQLLNLARHKLRCSHSSPEQLLKPVQKPKSNKKSSTG
jgi:hypothetical protein